ncbi:hypothetical protein [Microcella humidisoli]|uniref:Tryptophan-rich sensory protein n=1 Tax=Microcella humidisoli TaxID=2963406 RepID=A0ABY5FZN3_9MICO|nr:hypothetical protein [Microcella humidisoli]UTT63596.1 hypothetical protein NNL39_05715 [Microcella humidisoli]
MSNAADVDTTATSPDPARGRRRALRALVVVLAIGQPVSSLVFDWLSPTDLQSGAEFSPLVPPGAWFAIWGLIIVASIAWSLAQARPSTITDSSGVRDQLALPMAIVYLCFGLWLAAASLGQENPVGLLVFAVIITAHVMAWQRVVAARDEIAQWNPVERGLLYLMLGTYSGWTSMAFFVQVATVTQGSGAEVDTAWGITWQLLVLAAAAGMAVGFVIVSRGSIVYAATVTYALIGVGLSTAEAGLTVLWVACVIAVSVVWASVGAVRATDARRTRG